MTDVIGKNNDELKLAQERKTNDLPQVKPSASASQILANPPIVPDTKEGSLTDLLEPATHPLETSQDPRLAIPSTVDNSQLQSQLGAINDLSTSSFPVPVNIDYRDPIKGSPNDVNPLNIVNQAVAEQKQATDQNQQFWLDQAQQSLATPSSAPSSQFWYPEGFYDLERNYISTDNFLKEQQKAGYELNIGGSGTFTTATENAIKAQGGLSSVLGQQLKDGQNQEISNDFWSPVGDAVGALGAGIGTLGNWLGLGKKENVEGARRDFGKQWQSSQHLQRLAARLNNPNDQSATGGEWKPNEFNPLAGKFGDYGNAGAVSAALYMLNIPQSVLNGLMYDVADTWSDSAYAWGQLLKGRSVEDITKDKQKWHTLFDGDRIAESIFGGVDYGFTNFRSRQKPLAVIDPKSQGWARAGQIGAGLVLDMITGGVADSFTLPLVGGRFAAREAATAGKLAANTPNFQPGKIVPKPPLPTEVKEALANISVPDYLKKLINTPLGSPEAVQLAQRHVLPRHLQGKSTQVIQQTQQLIVNQGEFNRLSDIARVTEQKMLQAQQEMLGLRQRLEAMPNLERNPILGIQDTQRMYGIEPQLPVVQNVVPFKQKPLQNAPNTLDAPSIPVEPSNVSRGISDVPGEVPSNVVDIKSVVDENPVNSFDDIFKRSDPEGTKYPTLEDKKKYLLELMDDMDDPETVEAIQAAKTPQDLEYAFRVFSGDVEGTQNAVMAKAHPGRQHGKPKVEAIDGSNVIELPHKDNVVGINRQQIAQNERRRLFGLPSQKPKLTVVESPKTRLPIPDRLFHGTKTDVDDIASINPLAGSSSSNELGSGVYFTNRQGVASQYALAQPQMNTPEVLGAIRKDIGNVYEVTPRLQNPLNAAKHPSKDVRKVFVDVATELDEVMAAKYIGRIGNVPLERYWTIFRETWADVYPNLPIPEDVMLEFNRQTAARLASLGYDGVFKWKGKDFVLNVFKKADDKLPVEQLLKVPQHGGETLELQKLHRVRADNWAKGFWETPTHDAQHLQSVISLADVRLNQLTDEWFQAEEAAMLQADTLVKVESKLGVEAIEEAREKAIRIYQRLENSDIDVPTTNPKNKFREGVFTSQELSDVERHVGLFLSNAFKARSNNTSDVATKLVSERYANIAGFNQASKLNPELTTRSIPHVLVRDFAVYMNGLGFGSGLSKSGEVRQFLHRARQLWEGGVHDALAKMDTLNTISQAQKAINPLRRKYRIPRNEWNALTVLAEESSWYRYVDEYMNLAPRGKQYIKARQENLMNRLASYGMTEEDINTIIISAAKVADTYHEVLAVAQKAGINVGELEKIGYFPRMFSEEALKRFDWERLGDDTVKFSDGSISGMQSVFTKSRSTFDYVVEDEVILDWLLRTKNPDIYKELNVDNIRDLVEDTGKLGEALFNHLGMDGVDQLVNMGLFSKIPMTTEEVYEHLMKKYPRLPFKGLNEMVATDWTRATEMYRDKLENLAGHSGITWQLVRNAVEGSWGITEAEKFANPQKYAKFVPLSDAISESMRKLSGVDALDAFSKTYVHPVAAQLYHAMTDISISPHKLGVVGGTIKEINDMFRVLALSTPDFMKRQVLDKIIQIGASGGDISDYLPTFTKLVAAHKLGLNKVLDNSRAIYKGQNGKLLTELELYDEGVKLGILNPYTILNGEKVGTAYHSWNPANIEQGMRFIGNALNEYESVGKALGEVKDLAHRVINDFVGYPSRIMNNWTENAAKFSVLKSVTGTGIGERGTFIEKARAGLKDASKVAQSGQIRHMNVNEAKFHIDQYFFDYSNVGQMDKMMSQYVIPFWLYRSRNLNSQLRNLLRNPHLFHTWNKMYAMQNAPMYLEDDDFPQGGIPDHILKDRALYWKDGDEYFALPMNNIDPMSDAWDTVGHQANAILNMFGIWKDQTRPKTTKGQLEELPWNNKTNTFLDAWIKESFPVFQGIAGTIKKENVRTGKSLEESDTRVSSFLGVEMSPLTRYWMETLVPTLGYLNRQNYGQMFGTKDRFDSKTGELIEKGKPSIFGVKRSDFDRTNDAVSRNRIANAIRGFGLTPQHLDIAYNMGYREEDVKRALKDGRMAIANLQKTIPTMAPSKQAEMSEKLQAMKDAWVLLRGDYQRFHNWRTARGLQPMAALRELKRQQLTIHQLDLSVEDEEKLINEVLNDGSR